ncbi:hypothetical protein PAXRUDRAFT_135989, partial [Paxillus rubicundulus Ve08.2h10]
APCLLPFDNFCELWYFTNNSLADAKQSGTCALDNNYLALFQTPDRMPFFIPAIIAKDKTPVIQDENLTWEQFEQAALQMIDAMHNHEWRDNHIEMHLKLWTALKNHPWHHSHSKYSPKALLRYQGQQRCHWHQLVATPKAFSIAELQQELIEQVCEHLMHQDKVNGIQKLNFVRSLFG